MLREENLFLPRAGEWKSLETVGIKEFRQKEERIVRIQIPSRATRLNNAYFGKYLLYKNVKCDKRLSGNRIVERDSEKVFSNCSKNCVSYLQSTMVGIWDTKME